MKVHISVKEERRRPYVMEWKSAVENEVKEGIFLDKLKMRMLGYDVDSFQS